MTAIETLKGELLKVQQAQEGCISSSGYVQSCYRYRYQMLVNQGADLRSALNWMEQLYKGRD